MALTDFLVNTDYPSDKIIFVYEGSISVSAGGFQFVEIPHGLSGAPLPSMIWSTTSDFSIAYDVASGPYPDDLFAWYLGIVASIRSYNNHIYVDFTNFQSSSYTIYYRIFCYPKTSDDYDTAGTSNQADKFIYNTDYNYPKIYLEGELDLSVSNVVNHNLGYLPQVQVWIEVTSVDPNDTYIKPVAGGENYLDATGGGFTDGISLNTSSLTIDSNFFVADKAFYKIYLDKQKI